MAPPIRPLPLLIFMLRKLSPAVELTRTLPPVLKKPLPVDKQQPLTLASSLELPVEMHVGPLE